MTNAKKTYVSEIAHEIYLATNPDPEQRETWPEGEDALWLSYALLCLAKGDGTTSEDVHNAWSVWSTMTHFGKHPSAIPFDELTPRVQGYDDLYRDAIHQVHRRRNYDPGSALNAALSWLPRFNIATENPEGTIEHMRAKAIASVGEQAALAHHRAKQADYRAREARKFATYSIALSITAVCMSLVTLLALLWGA